ncbi:putative 1-phosphatidylinositol 4-kinase [Helianthus annuus]|nr:putative 1-phosphatidylinositol 4-kinase [Helianthus annuus]
MRGREFYPHFSSNGRYNLEKVFIYSCDNFHGLCICCFVRSYVDDKLYVRNFYCFHFNVSGISFHLFRTLKKKKMESWSLNLLKTDRLEDSNFIDVTACANEEVNTVKHRIQTCNGFVVKKQKLVFGGRELSRNNSLVRDYVVCSGDVLHLIIGVSDLLVITVETAVGEEFEFRC